MCTSVNERAASFGPAPCAIFAAGGHVFSSQGAASVRGTCVHRFKLRQLIRSFHSRPRGAIGDLADGEAERQRGSRKVVEGRSTIHN